VSASRDNPLPIFTVSIQGPGPYRWRIPVRAPDQETAAGNVASRGHTVLAVTPGAGTYAPLERRVRGACIRCGYAIGELPAGPAGEVMCPECGVINAPDALLVRVAERRGRHRVARLWLWGVIIGGVVLLWLTPLLLRFL
jgi:hypothetical protein